MNIDIIKIENGFVVDIGGKKTFCSEAMGICGLLAEWAQATVERLEKTPSPGEQLSEAMAKIQAQMMAAPMIKPLQHYTVGVLNGDVSPGARKAEGSRSW